MPTLKSHQWLVILLLLAHFAIRSHNLTAQDAFIDEGFHIVRSAVVWDFDQHPARVAHGKLLLYFWLGLFEVEPTQALPIGRLSIALFSLLTSASLYGLGRFLVNHWAGLLAMGFYALLPWAFFFERMALADPFAAGFLGVAAWRSLIFVRKGLKPAYHGRVSRAMLLEGAFLGMVLGFMTIAKLTTGLLPFLPAVAALVFYDWNLRQSLIPQAVGWFKTYFIPLVVAAIVLTSMWLPIIIPAYLADQNGEPFVLVDDQASRDDGSQITVKEYLDRLPPIIYDFTSRELWQGILISGAVMVLLSLWGWDTRLVRVVAFLLAWMALLAVLPITRAVLVRSRYFLPVAPPLMLMLACLITYGWQKNLITRGVSLLMCVGVGVWVVQFAYPFLETDLTEPIELTFHTENYIEYTAGYFLSDAAVAQTGAEITALNLTTETVYAPWNLCHLLYFQTDYPLTCLSRSTPMGDLRRYAARDLQPNEIGYLAMADYSRLFFQEINGLRSQQLSQYERTKITRPVTLWQIWWMTTPD